jgi:predicted O-methyltransferase YrrM
VTSSKPGPPAPTHRLRIGPRKIAAVIAGVVVALVAAGLYALWATTGLVVLVLALQVVTILGLGAALVESNRRLTRRLKRADARAQQQVDDLRRRLRRQSAALAALDGTDERVAERVAERVRTEADTRHAELLQALSDHRDKTANLVRTTGGDLRDTSEEHTARLETAVDRTRKRIQRTLRHDRDQIEALFNLHHTIDIRAAIPPLHGYGAAPDFQTFLVTLVADEKPASVLECGSGTSTVLLAYALERIGSGKLISLEHDERYYTLTRQELERHRLTEWVDLRLAPLRAYDIDGEEYQWYDLSQIEPMSAFDLLIVDGPPQGTGKHARYPALPLLADHLRPRATVVLDDHDRRDERETVERWLAEYPGFDCEIVEHERGTAVLRRHDPQVP